MDEILIKVALSLILGGALGMERQYHDKPAGYATTCLICLGATLFTRDPGRIAAQIVTGVGFIGAGSILRDGNKISGLTTAAGVWLVAAIGMAVGYGEYVLAALFAASILLIQLGVRKTIKLLEFVKHYDTIYLQCTPKWAVVDDICRRIESHKISILKQEVTKQDNMFVVAITATFTGREFYKITKDLLEMPEVKSLYK